MQFQILTPLAERPQIHVYATLDFECNYVSVHTPRSFCICNDLAARNSIRFAVHVIDRMMQDADCNCQGSYLLSFCVC
jgi:hypothetical protein